VKITSTLFDSTQRRLITGAHDGTIKLWNFSTGQPLKEFVDFGEGEVTGIACMHMTPYDYVLATGWNRKVTFWLDPHSLPADKAAAMPTLQPQHHMEGPAEDILCMACYPEIHLLVTGAYDGDIIIWNLDSGHPRVHLVLPGLASLKTQQKPIEAMQLVGIRSDFRHKFEKKKKVDNIVVLLITASGDGVIRIWSTDSTAELLLGNLLICRKHSVQS
jgi:WD40 repeat protein